WIDPVQMAAIRRTFDAADLTEAVGGSRVTATVLVQVLNQPDETDELLDIASASSLVTGVIGWSDVRRLDLAEQIDRLRRRGPLVGIRHQLQAEAAPAQWLQRRDVGDGLRRLADTGLVFDLMIRPEQFDVAVDVVRSHPDLTFVLDHLGKPRIDSGLLEPWASGLQRLAHEPNVVAKLSGLVSVADRQTWAVEDLRPYVDVALNAFGASRLMFGSDWPVCLVAAGYAAVIGAVEALVADLTPGERHDIWAATARRVYSLG
ncbi:MAG: L-fuconolactonase, partial [Pseudonocardiales bacterium]|nr:L-fuconolactonase [Pseudonocardiales bacterium]